MLVDKHDSGFTLPHPPDPLGVVKGQIFKFRNNSVRCQYFTEISHADRGTINLKHITRDFRSKTCVRSPGWTMGVGSKSQNSNFSEHGHVVYQIKSNHKCSNIVAHTLPADPLTLGLGSKGQNAAFSEHCHVAYQVKGNGS